MSSGLTYGSSGLAPRTVAAGTGSSFSHPIDLNARNNALGNNGRSMNDPQVAGLSDAQKRAYVAGTFTPFSPGTMNASAQGYHNQPGAPGPTAAPGPPLRSGPGAGGGAGASGPGTPGYTGTSATDPHLDEFLTLYRKRLAELKANEHASLGAQTQRTIDNANSSVADNAAGAGSSADVTAAMQGRGPSGAAGYRRGIAESAQRLMAKNSADISLQAQRDQAARDQHREDALTAFTAGGAGAFAAPGQMNLQQQDLALRGTLGTSDLALRRELGEGGLALQQQQAASAEEQRRLGQLMALMQMGGGPALGAY